MPAGHDDRLRLSAGRSSGAGLRTIVILQEEAASPLPGYRTRVARQRVWERARRVDPLVWDSLLALVLLVAHVLVGVVVSDEGGSEALAILLIVVACAPLALRRRAPIVVVSLVAVAAAVYAIADLPGDLAIPLAVATYTAAAYRDRGPVLAVALPASVAAAVVLQIDEPRRQQLGRCALRHRHPGRGADAARPHDLQSAETDRRRSGARGGRCGRRGTRPHRARAARCGGARDERDGRAGRRSSHRPRTRTGGRRGGAPADRGDRS